MVKKKIFNDPMYRLMHFEHDVLYKIIDHPYFQRLRRISQLALSHYVYPGGQHSRYQHALGALHLLHQALQVLRSKGVEISDEESRAVCIAILLHDIGHGPFSHALEGIILPFSHEKISYKVMEMMEKDLAEDFKIAKKIYRNDYHRPFLNQLVSSQLDMDRMDYLNRDSFFSGVAEGTIGYDRIITMLNVVNDQLVVEENGVYSVEKFLVARKIMYWQVYLHKAAIGIEQVLLSAVRRSIYLLKKNYQLFSPEAFCKLVTNESCPLDEKTVRLYLSLDDVDIWYMIKQGQLDKDRIFAKLCDCVLERKLFKTQLLTQYPEEKILAVLRKEIAQNLGISEDETGSFLIIKIESFLEYRKGNTEIMILCKDGSVHPFSDLFPEYAQKTEVTKFALCYYAGI